ncbi:oligosaccharide flippase family protein [Vibrio fluvialis]|nr:oligosaccharide flippase family protein [Vibrio fluvialis]
MLREQLKKNIIKSISARYSQYTIQLLLLMVYSRLFLPEDFGSIALITVVVNFFMVFGEAGISSALVTKRDLTYKERCDIFGFTFVLAICISLLVYASLYLMNIVYTRDDYQYIGVYSTFSVFFLVITSVPLAGLMSDKKFFRIAINSIISEIITLCIVLILYKAIDNIYLLGVRFSLQALFYFILTYITCKGTNFGQPIPTLTFSSVNKIKEFSVYLLGFNFINYLSRNFDNFLVGKFMGEAYLGLYDRTYSLMRYPLQLITFAVSPAIQPVLTEKKYERTTVKNVHQSIANKVLLLSSIIAVIIYVNSNLIVSIILGSQWEKVGELLSIMSLAIPLMLITSFNGGFWQAFDETKSQFKVGIFTLLVMMFSMGLGIYLSNDLKQFSYAVVIGLNITNANAFCQLFKKLYGSSYSRCLLNIMLLLSSFYSIVFIYEYLNIIITITLVQQIVFSIISVITIFIYFKFLNYVKEKRHINHNSAL